MNTRDPGELSDAGFHHVAVSVPDMEAAKRFFIDLFGFTVEREQTHLTGDKLSQVVGLPGADTWVCRLKGFGMRIELFQYHHPRGKPAAPERMCDFGITHFALAVKHVHEIRERLRAAGVEFYSPPLEVRPGATVCYCKGPGGITIELAGYEE